MIIDIFSDPICPWCFIGKRRLERTFRGRPDLSAEVRWRAFQLNPSMPREGMDRRAYLAAKFGGDRDADRIYDHIRQVGRNEGIEFAFEKIQRTPNTVQAHRLLRHAAREGALHAVSDGLFRGYFVEGRDIGDDATLTAIAEEAGLAAQSASDYLSGDQDAEEIRQEDAMARRMGIEGVPCFIVNQRYAISGAQEPEAFYQLFDLVQQEERNEGDTVEA
ncbi:MAG: DsbA family oxidoreductase [Alphaproteobacteria bacterium]